MKALWFLPAILTQTVVAWSQVYDLKEYPDHVQIHSLLVYEFQRSPQTPPEHATIWGRILVGLDKVREARDMMKLLEKKNPKDPALVQGRARMEALESTYHEIFWPAMTTLAGAISRTRRLHALAAIAYKKREMAEKLKHIPGAPTPKLDTPAESEELFRFLKSEREQISILSAQSEEMLKKARARLSAGKEPAAERSVAGALIAAEASFASAAQDAAKTAQSLSNLTAYNSEYYRALAAMKDFDQDVLQGRFSEEKRAKAAQGLNEAGDKTAALETNVAGDIREVVALWKLLRSDGNL